MQVIIGEGIKGRKEYDVFLREADIADDMKDMTLTEIAVQLAKQAGFKDCIVNLTGLSFSMERPAK